MMTRRITPVAVLLAAVLTMGTEAAKAQETVTLAIPINYGVRPSNTKVIVTGNTGRQDLTFVSLCMTKRGFDTTHTERMMVAVDSNYPPAATIVLGGLVSSGYGAGTTVVDLTLIDTCFEASGEYAVYTGTIANPRNRDIALVTTPADITLAEDHEAVVGAGTDEFGIADAVCVKNGQKAIKTEIISDIPLEPGDRLTDFLELDFNPDTGIALYGAFLEY